MKRFASKLFSKLTIGATIIILQFGWFVYLIYSAKRSSSAANMALEVCAVALALYISNKDMRTSFKMSWIFLVLFLPMFGIPAYFLFGRSEITKRTRRKMEAVADKVIQYRIEDKNVIEELKENGIKIAVCSNKPDNVVHFVTDNIFGENYFDAVHGVIDGMPTKPNPFTALEIAKKLGVKPSECLFLGDTNVDIFTAKNAETTSVGVLWGFRTRNELVQAGADYIAENPHVILQLIGR